MPLNRCGLEKFHLFRSRGASRNSEGSPGRPSFYGTEKEARRSGEEDKLTGAAARRRKNGRHIAGEENGGVGRGRKKKCGGESRREDSRDVGLMSQ
jgi:hypothetical protein